MAYAGANPIFLHLPSFGISDLCFARLGAATLAWATERIVRHSDGIGVRPSTPMGLLQSDHDAAERQPLPPTARSCVPIREPLA